MSTQIVEHIVLFKTKTDTDPSKVRSMINALNGLASLDQVLHLTAGPLLRTRSSSPLTFTHILHSRYQSKHDLDAYSGHPAHVTVVSDYVKPICDDVMAIDWVAECSNTRVVLRPGSAIRVTLVKLKEGSGERERGEVLGAIGNCFPAIDQVSFGENFSARAKGFSIGSIAVFPGLSELEALDPNLIGLEKENVRDLVDSVMVLDYVIPRQQSSRL